MQEKNFSNFEIEKLTPREQQIAGYLDQALRYKEIASNLNLSIETVRKHVHNIYRKLNVQSRTEAINKLYQR